MRVVGVVLSLLVLAGCANHEKAKADRAAAQQSCRAMPEWSVARAHCFNAAQRTYMTAIEYPYSDLVRLAETKRVVIAEQVEAGKLTKAEADAAWADVRMTVNSEADRRDGRRSVNAPVTCTTTGVGAFATTSCW
jgi:RecB family exonuclease